MTGFNIIMVIAIILFARLGVRLFLKWNELKKQNGDKEHSELNPTDENDTDADSEK